MNQPATATLLQADDVLLPARPHNSHKGNYGRVLIVGGDTGMAGAVALAARAALTAGAGLVRVITRPQHIDIVTTLCPEAMVYGSDNGDIPALLETDQVSHVLAGCGMGQQAWSHRLLHHVRKMACPVLYDADAINLIAAEYDVLDNAAVLTPHPGEAARLLGISTAEVQQQRYTRAAELADKYACSIVLKGSGSIVAEPGGMWVCDRGNAAMASAGMGDVLAGLLVGLLAQGLQAGAACQAAVYYHARAAELAAAGRTRGIRASDVIAGLPEVMHESRTR